VRASFNVVLTGSYTVQASKSGYLSGSEPANVVLGGSSIITITLQAQSSSNKVPGFPPEAVIIGLVLTFFLMFVYRKSEHRL
jgi:hypothetical protein